MSHDAIIITIGIILLGIPLSEMCEGACVFSHHDLFFFFFALIFLQMTSVSFIGIKKKKEI